jgi:hypothetical protein
VQALNQPFAAVTTEVGIGPFALLCKGHYLRIAVIGAGRSECPQTANLDLGQHCPNQIPTPPSAPNLLRL